MKIVRFVLNIVLAAIVTCLIAAIFVVVGGLAITRVWENQGLDYGVQENGTWLWLDDEPIHYLEWGGADDPPVVLVHGRDIQGSVVWAGNARDLSRRGYRVLAVDLRGYGHTTREGEAGLYSVEEQALLLAKVLNTLRVRDAVVMSHGSGAGVVLRLAAEQPQFVKSLVLLSPHDGSDYERIWRTAAQWPYVGDAVTWYMLSGGPVWEYRQWQLLPDRDALPDGYRRMCRAPSHTVGSVQSLLHVATLAADEDPYVDISLDQPITVAVGVDDPTVDMSSARDMARRLAAELVVVQHAGHYPQLDRPTQVNRLVMDAQVP